MLWALLRLLRIFLLLQCGDRLYSSESDVYRRQFLTTKVDPRAVRVEGETYLHSTRFKNGWHKYIDKI